LKKIIHRLTHWEAWPFNLIYAPLAPFWLYYMFRSRSVWFFTPSNPKITFGGLEGETKKEMYELLPTHLYPATFSVMPKASFATVVEQMQHKQIKFPCVVKPEVGGQGILFRKIDYLEQLAAYHQQVTVEYMVQAMVQYPMEVSVFYIRHPKEQKGRITGFLHKIPMRVVGDGIHCLEQLILQHPKAAKRTNELFAKHQSLLQQVIPAGETYVLSYAGNHNRGAHFVDLKDHINESLLDVFDALSHSIDDFFYGRYDIMCNSIEDLQQGKEFMILEYNGCGAEPNHIYDTGYSLRSAHREILLHWKSLYEISRYNALQGHQPWPFWKGLSFLRATRKIFKEMRTKDQSIH
jgi:hypothetical protein